MQENLMEQENESAGEGNSESGRDDNDIREEIGFPDPKLAMRLCGPHNQHLGIIREQTGTVVGNRGDKFYIKGSADKVSVAVALLKKLYGLVEQGFVLYPEDIDQACRLVATDPKIDLKSIFLDTVTITSRGRAISPRGPAQKKYLDTIRSKDIVFAIGPAGTGKTYLAMAMAVAGLMNKQFDRIILCRPAVEAGEKLGFLPGNLAEKVNPYLRPLYDALHDLMDDSRAYELVERGIVEVAPLAFMRGRTLNDAFVILDEAQNSTGEQMKMFLTRLGFRSKAVVTGDITQIDLPAGASSGLIQAERILRNVEGIGFSWFSDRDVVRHPLVRRVIRAYEDDKGSFREP